MDVEFYGLNPSSSDSQDFKLRFSVKDKNGDIFRDCLADKETKTVQIGNLPPLNYVKLDDVVMKLKKGDKIRLRGKVHLFDKVLILESIEMIEPLNGRPAR